MKKVKIAQIGTSACSHGNHAWKSITSQTDIFDVVGYAFPENEREKFPRHAEIFNGYREMTVEEILSDPEIEAVTVETEEIYLTKYAIMAAKAGKHIHMEKPGGIRLADFEKLIEILKEKKLAFSTGYMYRFNPMVKDSLEKIRNGELGKIYSVEAHMSCPEDKDLKEWLSTFPGGMMFYLGCHLVDLIYQIQGEPEEVIPLNTVTGIDGIQSEDLGMAVFKYKDGVSFAKTSGSEFGGFMRRQLVICGEKGSIEIKPLEVIADNGVYTVLNDYYTDSWTDPWRTEKTDVYPRYDVMLKNFAELVRGKENPYSYDYELNLYKLILKACKNEIK